MRGLDGHGGHVNGPTVRRPPRTSRRPERRPPAWCSTSRAPCRHLMAENRWKFDTADGPTKVISTLIRMPRSSARLASRLSSDVLCVLERLPVARTLMMPGLQWRRRSAQGPVVAWLRRSGCVAGTDQPGRSRRPSRAAWTWSRCGRWSATARGRPVTDLDAEPTSRCSTAACRAAINDVRPRRRPGGVGAAVRRERQHGRGEQERARAGARPSSCWATCGRAATRPRSTRSTRRCTWCSRSRPTSMRCKGGCRA